MSGTVMTVNAISSTRSLLAAATIRGRRLFGSELPIVRLLFEGGDYSRVATIRWWHLFKEIRYMICFPSRILLISNIYVCLNYSFNLISKGEDGILAMCFL